MAFGIKKLQISCVVEDDKVGTDFLEEAITAFEDLVCCPLLMLSSGTVIVSSGPECGHCGIQQDIDCGIF